jgi:hypothetical protein
MDHFAGLDVSVKETRTARGGKWTHVQVGPSSTLSRSPAQAHRSCEGAESRTACLGMQRIVNSGGLVTAVTRFAQFGATERGRSGGCGYSGSHL